MNEEREQRRSPIVFSQSFLHLDHPILFAGEERGFPPSPVLIVEPSTVISDHIFHIEGSQLLSLTHHRRALSDHRQPLRRRKGFTYSFKRLGHIFPVTQFITYSKRLKLLLYSLLSEVSSPIYDLSQAWRCPSLSCEIHLIEYC